MQIFLRPRAAGLEPQVRFHDLGEARNSGRWRLTARPRDAPLEVRAEAWVHDLFLANDGDVPVPPVLDGMNGTRLLYLFEGQARVGDVTLDAGESLILDRASAMVLATKDSDLVLFTADLSAPVFRGGMFSGNVRKASVAASRGSRGQPAPTRRPAGSRKGRTMRVLVHGATGGTGRAIVRLAQTRGHDVTILARRPEKANDLGQVRVIQGDALDPVAVGRAVEGTEAVISAIGTPVSPFRDVTLLSSATRILTDEMQRQGVSQLIAITGMGAGDSAGHGGFLFDLIFKPLMLRKVCADKDRQEAIIRGSRLECTIIRPSVLSDKPARSAVRALTNLSNFHGAAFRAKT